jgi:hypothetical protein
VAGSTTKASTYDARIKDKPKLDFTLRFQGKSSFQNKPGWKVGAVRQEPITGARNSF